MRHLSNEDRTSVCETPLCALRAVRKRCYWQPKDTAENVAAKKAKAAGADILVRCSFVRFVIICVEFLPSEYCS